MERRPDRGRLAALGLLLLALFAAPSASAWTNDGAGAPPGGCYTSTGAPRYESCDGSGNINVNVVSQSPSGSGSTTGTPVAVGTSSSVTAVTTGTSYRLVQLQNLGSNAILCAATNNFNTGTALFEVAPQATYSFNTGATIYCFSLTAAQTCSSSGAPTCTLVMEVKQ